MESSKKVRVVCATTKTTLKEFYSQTLLGRSLSLFPPDLAPEVSVRLSNGGSDRIGLGKLYNGFLSHEHCAEIVLFIHDDVWLDDWWLIHRLTEAAQHFDVIGLAGNSAPDFAEPAWLLAWNKKKYPKGIQPLENMSGAVAHLSKDKGAALVSYYGPAPRACRLLDGLFIAVNVAEALAKGACFDEDFEFHFYDLDFCRQAEICGLRLGTWPIAATHASGGSFESPAWVAAMKRYSKKWPLADEAGAETPADSISSSSLMSRLWHIFKR